MLLVVRYGAWQQLYATPGQLVAVCCGYVLARAMAGVLIVHAPKAKSTGLAALFAAPAGHGRTVALSIWCVAAMALPVLLGGGVRALLVPVLALVLPVYVYRMAKARFGGITGDLAGYYIALSETLLLVLAALLGAPA